MKGKSATQTGRRIDAWLSTLGMLCSSLLPQSHVMVGSGNASPDQKTLFQFFPRRRHLSFESGETCRGVHNTQTESFIRAQSCHPPTVSTPSSDGSAVALDCAAGGIESLFRVQNLAPIGFCVGRFREMIELAARRML